ncbi:MAG TPA: amidohydrolase family protein [Ferruginibacter sp.]|nr:amidohydrolase family protein [Ferruginibacter sp.]HMP21224.1 amidohydrolase family protein [Ferruginibacter sp.]
MPFTKLTTSIALILLCINWSTYKANAQRTDANTILIEAVNIFDGKTNRLLLNQYVLIEGNTIKTISPLPITGATAQTVIQAKGKTLMPGLIDVHIHMVFGGLTMEEMMAPDFSEDKIIEKISSHAEKMLLRGFTAVRDVGGPIFPLKMAIDKGLIRGPRIWPSGATISQTAGHGDFRLPNEHSRRFTGEISRAEKYGATFIADGRDEVLTAVRENLRFGASQLKLMAGGGTSSEYDPVDVTQYTLDEMKAAVEAAADWGTYVTVHAYTTRAVRRAIEAGVKCIEHGQMLDMATLKLMQKKGIWLSCQNLEEGGPDMNPLRLQKRQPVIEGQKKIWSMAKQAKVKLAWGTDFLFKPKLYDEQNDYILKLKPWFSPYEILKMVTHDNAQLLALSGLRSPYTGKLGVVEQGALADLILVDGNPLLNINLIGNPAEKFLLIIKDGQIIKNTLK